MNTVTITISRDHYDLILKAIDAYNENLKLRLTEQAKTWNVRAEAEKMIATTMAAPWGLKKDGTPKKQPGRKAS